MHHNAEQIARDFISIQTKKAMAKLKKRAVNWEDRNLVFDMLMVYQQSVPTR